MIDSHVSKGLIDKGCVDIGVKRIHRFYSGCYGFFIDGLYDA